MRLLLVVLLVLELSVSAGVLKRHALALGGGVAADDELVLVHRLVYLSVKADSVLGILGQVHVIKVLTVVLVDIARVGLLEWLGARLPVRSIPMCLGR